MSFSLSRTAIMLSTSSNTINSSLLSRQLARAAHPRPWLSNIKVASTSSSSSDKSIPTSQPSSSLTSRAAARASRPRPWLTQSIQPIAAPAVKPTSTPAAWVQSQAKPITLSHAVALLPSPSPPSKRLTSWIATQAVSPVPSSIPVPAAWGRKSSAYQSRRYRQQAIQSSKILPRATTWGRKSTGLTLRQAFALVSSPSPSPVRPIPPPAAAISFDKETMELIANILELYDPEPLQIQEARLDQALKDARLAYAALLETERQDAIASDSSIQEPILPIRKTVTFADNLNKVAIVPRWIGIIAPKQDHVSGSRSFLGHLRAWTPVDGDIYSHLTTWCSDMDNTSYSHADCSNPDCHIRAKDLYMMDPIDDWTPPE